MVWCGSVAIASQHAGGDGPMGFDQEKTTHHFRLTADGGVIQVDANDVSDAKNIRLIRMHLKEIAGEFEKGNFQKPFAVHNEVPPGVPQMQQLRTSIKYAFSETPRGALVRISTSNKAALEEIHNFLRYQIREHRTGDPTTIE